MHTGNGPSPTAAGEDAPNRWATSLAALGALAVLCLTRYYSYPLFHSLAETFSVVVACGIFMVAWNSRRFLAHGYFLFLGAAYLAASLLDLLHMLAYKGMGVFPGHSSNIPTTLWIAARYLEAISLLLAPWFLTRKSRPSLILSGYAAATGLLILAVFCGWFPVCYVEGQGLTAFKIVSEYIICAILVAALVFVRRRKERFDPDILRLVCASIGVTVAMELSFTLYTDPYGLFNMVGHALKIVSFALLYKAIIETGVRQPYRTLFRDLAESREWLRVTLASIGDAVMTCDTGGRIAFLNPIATALTGWTAEEANGRPGREVFKTADEQTLKPLEDLVERVLREKRVLFLAEQAVLIPKNGEVIPVEDSAAPIFDAAGEVIGVVLVFRDVTEKRRARAALRQANEELEIKVRERTAELQQAVATLQSEIELRKRAEEQTTAANAQLKARAAQLRALAGELALAEQRERQRMAKVLHDHLQQLLVAARLHLGGLTHKLDAGSRGAAAQIDELLNESIGASRSLTSELCPPGMHKKDLAEGLGWLTRWMAEKHGLEVDLMAEEGLPALPEDMAVLLFESVRELLFNVVKHAQTLSAQVHLRRLDGQGLQIAVCDEGRGFDPAKLQAEKRVDGGFGLFSVRERLELIGARLQVRSAPGSGSRFVLTVPLADGNASGEGSLTTPLIRPPEELMEGPDEG